MEKIIFDKLKISCSNINNKKNNFIFSLLHTIQNTIQNQMPSTSEEINKDFKILKVLKISHQLIFLSNNSLIENEDVIKLINSISQYILFNNKYKNINTFKFLLLVEHIIYKFSKATLSIPAILRIIQGKLNFLRHLKINFNNDIKNIKNCLNNITQIKENQLFKKIHMFQPLYEQLHSISINLNDFLIDISNVTLMEDQQNNQLNRQLLIDKSIVITELNKKICLLVDEFQVCKNNSIFNNQAIVEFLFSLYKNTLCSLYKNTLQGNDFDVLKSFDNNQSNLLLKDLLKNNENIFTIQPKNFNFNEYDISNEFNQNIEKLFLDILNKSLQKNIEIFNTDEILNIFKLIDTYKSIVKKASIFEEAFLKYLITMALNEKLSNSKKTLEDFNEEKIKLNYNIFKSMQMIYEKNELNSLIQIINNKSTNNKKIEEIVNNCCQAIKEKETFKINYKEWEDLLNESKLIEKNLEQELKNIYNKTSSNNFIKNSVNIFLNDKIYEKYLNSFVYEFLISNYSNKFKIKLDLFFIKKLVNYEKIIIFFKNNYDNINKQLENTNKQLKPIILLNKSIIDCVNELLIQNIVHRCILFDEFTNFKTIIDKWTKGSYANNNEIINELNNILSNKILSIYKKNLNSQLKNITEILNKLDFNKDLKNLKNFIKEEEIKEIIEIFKFINSFNNVFKIIDTDINILNEENDEEKLCNHNLITNLIIYRKLNLLFCEKISTWKIVDIKIYYKLKNLLNSIHSDILKYIYEFKNNILYDNIDESNQFYSINDLIYNFKFNQLKNKVNENNFETIKKSIPEDVKRSLINILNNDINEKIDLIYDDFDDSYDDFDDSQQEFYFAENLNLNNRKNLFLIDNTQNLSFFNQGINANVNCETIMNPFILIILKTVN